MSVRGTCRPALVVEPWVLTHWSQVQECRERTLTVQKRGDAMKITPTASGYPVLTHCCTSPSPCLCPAHHSHCAFSVPRVRFMRVMAYRVLVANRLGAMFRVRLERHGRSLDPSFHLRCLRQSWPRATCLTAPAAMGERQLASICSDTLPMDASRLLRPGGENPPVYGRHNDVQPVPLWSI